MVTNVSYNPYVAPNWQPQSTSAYAPAATGRDFMPSIPADSYKRISSMVANGAGGAWASYKFAEPFAEAVHNYMELGELGGGPGVAFASFKEMAGITLKGTGVSALVSAGISAVANGVGVYTGKVTQQEAVKNVVGDTISGAVGGLSAVTLGGLGGLAMVKMGFQGLPITIATVAIGAASGVGASFLKDKIQEKFFKS